MDTAWLHQLDRWHTFFLMSGTAGGILTGVLFVVISLAPAIVAAGNASSVRACISPNAVHFSAVLVVSCVFMAHALPRELSGWLLCAASALTLFYLWSASGRQPWHENGVTLADRIWYAALPYLAYALSLAAGVLVLRGAPLALPLVAVFLVLLMVIGVRNAWDLAIWMPVQEASSKIGR